MIYWNIVAAKQNQKFPFHFLSAPPTPPAEEKKKGKEKILVFAPATEGSGRGAQISPFVVQNRFEQSRAIQHQ